MASSEVFSPFSSKLLDDHILPKQKSTLSPCRITTTCRRGPELLQLPDMRDRAESEFLRRMPPPELEEELSDVDLRPEVEPLRCIAAGGGGGGGGGTGTEASKTPFEKTHCQKANNAIIADEVHF